MATLPTLAEIEAAAAVIAPVVPPTPTYSWPLLNARLGHAADGPRIELKAPLQKGRAA